jgi:cell division septum initiation protein DivIVA
MSMEIYKALDELKEHLEKTRQLFGITLGLNKDECAVLLRKIHAMLPEQVKEAAVITRDSERIVVSAREDAQMTLERAKSEAEKLLEAARREADRMMEQTKIEREQMLGENEILRLAKEQAGQIQADAEAEATRVRRGADDYALDVLTRLEGNVSKIMAAIERGKSELERSSHPVTPQKPK